MSIEVKLDTTGIDRLIREMPEQADKAVRVATLNVEASAKTKAPVDTGFLKNSIAGRSSGRFEGEVSVGAEYGQSIGGTLDVDAATKTIRLRRTVA